MRKVIIEVLKNPTIVALAAEDIIELVAPRASIEPQFVLDVSRVVLSSGSEAAARAGLSSLAENLTNVALTIHRQGAYREAGLELFETLLAMNVREARLALETLDRKPVQSFRLPSRRRRSRRSAKKASPQ